MAASDKNIIITPNRGGATAEPEIFFGGSGNNPIRLKVLDDSTGTLSFEGSAGQLFSINNSLTSGSIFSVNDVSGIPSIDVNADGTVLLAPFGGTVGIGTTTPTSKLSVAGTISATNIVNGIVVGGSTLTGSVSLTAGSNVTLTPSGSTITIASSGGGGGGGGVTGIVVGGATLTGNVSLTAGSNITLTPSGSTITIASSGGGGGVTTTAANTWTALQTFSVGITAYGATFGVGGVSMQNNQIRDVQLKDYYEIRAAPTISSGTLTLNLNDSNIFDVSLNGNITTMTVSNVPSGTVATGFTLLLTADGTLRTVTWPASFKWPGGSAPSVTSTNGKTDVYSFITLNNGTNWYGFVGGQNY